MTDNARAWRADAERRERATHLLTFYMRTMFERMGMRWDSDNDAEMAGLVLDLTTVEGHRHIVPSDDGFVNRSGPPEPLAAPTPPPAQWLPGSRDVSRCALCGESDFELPRSDSVGLREMQPWEGRSVAHRGCAADVERERARDEDLNAS